MVTFHIPVYLGMEGERERGRESNSLCGEVCCVSLPRLSDTVVMQCESALILVAIVMVVAGEAATKSQKRPNVVILLADDLGIGDVGCYGNTTIKTPHIDSLARDGVRLDHHLAAASMCTPSRAALLTARYPARYGLVGNKGTTRVIIHVASKIGLPLDEITLSTALLAANYTTAAVGKWHLGMRCGLLGRGCRGPQQHGFQYFYGLPQTLMDEMGHPDKPFFIFPLDGSDPFYQILLSVWLVSLVTLLWLRWRRSVVMFCMILVTLGVAVPWFIHTHYRLHTEKWWQGTPWLHSYMNGILMENDEVIEQPTMLEGLSQRLTDRSVRFIEEHAQDEQPFFLYHSFAHVHTPLFTAPHMAGRSVHGRYGDNVEEMDAMVGEILEAIKKQGIEENTLVYFLSDHGGHLEAEENGERLGGHNGLFKGGKGMGAAEGGIRVPGIFRWPGHIPAGATVNTPTSLLDTLPTVLELAGLPALHDLMPHIPRRDLDGKSIADVLTKGALAPSRTLIHHCGSEIHAVRFVFENTVVKLHFKGHNWKPGSTQCGWGNLLTCSCYDGEDNTRPILYDLRQDPYEDHPVDENSNKYHQMVGIMLQFVAEWKQRVRYPPSQFLSVSDVMHSMWLQPFRIL